MNEYIDMVQYAVPLLAIGGAWGGAKAALNGMKHRIGKLEEFEEDAVPKLASIETKVDMILERVNK